MARFRHPERGTEIEVDDDQARSLRADGFKQVGSDSADDSKSESAAQLAPRRRKQQAEKES